MSSTNRSDKRKKYDYYRTDSNFIMEFIDNIIEIPAFYDLFKYRRELDVLDPSAGGDSEDKSMPFVDVLYDYGFRNIISIDIRDDSSASIKDDFLKREMQCYYDLIITNPPFNLAEEFITKSFECIKSDGWIMMLLRLNFLESQKRKKFWNNYMPRYIFLNHHRMSFTGDSNTDSVPHAMFCWQKGNYPEFAKIKVI